MINQKTIFVVCLHGDEKTPLNTVKKYFAGIDYLVANKKALEKHARFIEVDMNRCFPGSKNGKLEEKQAYELLPELLRYNFVIDIHTATCRTPLFAIITKLTKDHIDLVKRCGIKKVVYMAKSIASGKSLIDYVPVGISIESGLEGKNETETDIKEVVSNYLLAKKLETKLEMYEVFEILQQNDPEEVLDSNVQNFQLVRKGDVLSRNKDQIKYAPFDFYPVLAREKSYPGVLCLMAKEINLNL